MAPAVVLVGCSDDPVEANLIEETPDTPALTIVVGEAEAALIAHYDAVLNSVPENQQQLRDALSALRQQHVEHRAAMAADGASPPLGSIPNSPNIGTLVTAEREAAKSRIASCEECSDPELARILAFIAASEASHVPVLRGLT